MPRVSRNSIKRDENGATYYVRSRTVDEQPFFADEKTKDWIYQHILWLGSVFFVTFRAISIADDRYQMVVSVRKPKLNPSSVEKRFNQVQRSNRIPLKWYEWRASEWHRKFGDLSEFMKRLNQSIARYLHDQGIVEGQVWRDRFKGEYLENDASLLAAMAFVELSCARTELSNDPNHYPWCSAGRQLNSNLKAGITLPRRAGFRFLGTGEQRHKSFCLFLNRLQAQGHHEKKLIQLKRLLNRVDPKTFLRPGKKRASHIRVPLGSSVHLR